MIRCIECGKPPRACKCPGSLYAKERSKRKDFFAAEAMKQLMAMDRGAKGENIAQEAWAQAEKMLEEE